MHNGSILLYLPICQRQNHTESPLSYKSFVNTCLQPIEGVSLGYCAICSLKKVTIEMCVSLPWSPRHNTTKKAIVSK